MKKFSKRVVYCKCVRINCPLKSHVIIDPDLRKIIRDEITIGIVGCVRGRTSVLIEGPEGSV